MTYSTPSLPPGFRFHPTDEELILHYLRTRAAAVPCPVSIIAEVDIYKFDPWDLPRQAMFGDREWYFFTPRDRKYPNGVRPNRAAASGYWKATGTDKPIVSTEGNECIGVKKALVFYSGRPPKGLKSNWIMHEYRLSESQSKNKSRSSMKFKDSSMRLDDFVLCRIYQKHSTSAEPELPKLMESQQENKLSLPKSASLTELFKEADFSLLSRLLDAPIEMPQVPEVPDPFGYANMGHTMFNNIPNQTMSASAPATENALKRQRTIEEEGKMMLHASKKSNNNSWDYNNYFDSQAFFNQQLMLKTHFGMQ